MKSEISVIKPTSNQLAHKQSLFDSIAELPAGDKWLASISNPNTRRAYQADINSFLSTLGIHTEVQFLTVEPGHISKWIETLKANEQSPATIRRKTAAVSSMYHFFCQNNLLRINPAATVLRPKVESYEGKTPTLSDIQARQLLDAADTSTLKGKRDAAILSLLLYHGLRRDEVAKLQGKHVTHSIRGVLHIVVQGKGGKIRYIPIQAQTLRLIKKYTKEAGHAEDQNGALFRAIDPHTKLSARNTKGLSTNAIYVIVTKYLGDMGLDKQGFGPHALRATAATNALENKTDMSRVQDWLGHAHISTTRMYDRRENKNARYPININYSGRKK